MFWKDWASFEELGCVLAELRGVGEGRGDLERVRENYGELRRN